MFHEILGFVIGYVCRKSAEMCQKRAGNLENDSARSCSCFLMLLFIWRAKKRVKLGVVIFRCFTITACFALIELQYVKENSNNPLIIFQEMFFILFCTFFVVKSFVSFYFATLGFQGRVKSPILLLQPSSKYTVYIYIHMCAIGVPGEGKIANMVATTRRQNIFSNTQTIFQYSIISFILYIYIYAPASPTPAPPHTNPPVVVYVVVEGGRSVSAGRCGCKYSSLPPVVGVCGSVGRARVYVCLSVCMYVSKKVSKYVGRCTCVCVYVSTWVGRYVRSCACM